VMWLLYRHGGEMIRGCMQVDGRRFGVAWVLRSRCSTRTGRTPPYACDAGRRRGSATSDAAVCWATAASAVNGWGWLGWFPQPC